MCNRQECSVYRKRGNITCITQARARRYAGTQVYGAETCRFSTVVNTAQNKRHNKEIPWRLCLRENAYIMSILSRFNTSFHIYMQLALLIEYVDNLIIIDTAIINQIEENLGAGLLRVSVKLCYWNSN